MSTLKYILAKLSKRNERKVSDRPGTTIQLYKEVFDSINFLTYIIGLEFTSDWKFNLRSKGCLMMNTLVLWAVFYTWYVLFPSVVCVELTAGTLVTLTILTKFTFFVMNHERFMSLVDFIYEVANRNEEGKRQEILTDITKTMFYHFKLVYAGFACGATVYSFYPVYDFIANGNLTPISPLLFPFAKDDSIRSFLIGSICNIIPPAWNMVGVAGLSCLFMTFVDVHASLILIIGNNLTEFDDMWTREDCNISLRNVVFRNILTEIMDLARYGAIMNQLFSLMSSVQVGSCFIGISASLFGLLANNYFGGIGASVYFLVELMLFCYIGQLIDNQIAEIQMAIFDSHWYMYEVRYQRDLMFALGIVQKLKSIDVAGIKPLNYATGLLVLKNVYSILMFLLNALE